MGIVKHFETIENVVSTMMLMLNRNLISTNRFAIQENWVPIKSVTPQYLLGIAEESIKIYEIFVQLLI